ncbi:MAG: alpha/beta hydrolase, partial [Clostridia bacterium]|nr:alpha/beta hydrolase [Clostridia bacterium]
SLGITIPKKIIMLSPWLDITLTNESIPKYECADPMLTKKDLQDCGGFWAGDTLTNDPKVSPIYSDIIPNTSMYIFAGTREIFCPDCIDYYAKLKKSKANVHLILGVGMNHVYPMYPILEAHKAFKQIKNIIER